MIKLKKFSDRERVPVDILEKAKTEGVVQKDHKGQWRIVSIDAGEYWDAVYDTKKDAEDALKAYHSNKNFSMQSGYLFVGKDNNSKPYITISNRHMNPSEADYKIEVLEGQGYKNLKSFIDYKADDAFKYYESLGGKLSDKNKEDYKSRLSHMREI